METFRTEPILPAFPLMFCRIPGARRGSCRCMQSCHCCSSLAEIFWAQTLTNTGHILGIHHQGWEQPLSPVPITTRHPLLCGGGPSELIFRYKEVKRGNSSLFHGLGLVA